MKSTITKVVSLLGCSSQTSGARLVATDAHTPSSSAFKSREDQSLSYVAFGNINSTSHTPIIIHHALFGSKENFGNIGKELLHLTKRSVIIPDARNHGNSPPCANPSMKQMSSDLVDFSSQLGVIKACFMGVAAGGRVAMITALTNPDKVEKLVLISSSPVNTLNYLARYERYRQACYIVQTFTAKHLPNNKNDNINMDNGVDFMLELNNALKTTMEDHSERALFMSNLGKNNTEALLNNPHMGKFPSMEGRIYHGPTLFITGEKKPSWDSDEEVRAIKHLFPNSYFVKIPGAGHWVHLEQTREFLATSVSFLRTSS